MIAAKLYDMQNTEFTVSVKGSCINSEETFPLPRKITVYVAEDLATGHVTAISVSTRKSAYNVFFFRTRQKGE
jgi:hypothetical protein